MVFYLFSSKSGSPFALVLVPSNRFLVNGQNISYRMRKFRLHYTVVITFLFGFVSEKLKSKSSADLKKQSSLTEKQISSSASGRIAAQTFTFRELAAATRNFRADCLLGEGGFGRVYKGRLESSNQVSLSHHIVLLLFTVVCLLSAYLILLAVVSFDTPFQEL